VRCPVVTGTNVFLDNIRSWGNRLSGAACHVLIMAFRANDLAVKILVQSAGQADGWFLSDRMVVVTMNFQRGLCGDLARTSSPAPAQTGSILLFKIWTLWRILQVVFALWFLVCLADFWWCVFRYSVLLPAQWKNNIFPLFKKLHDIICSWFFQFLPLHCTCNFLLICQRHSTFRLCYYACNASLYNQRQ
jgi:hypothetical protein